MRTSGKRNHQADRADRPRRRSAFDGSESPTELVLQRRPHRVVQPESPGLDVEFEKGQVVEAPRQVFGFELVKLPQPAGGGNRNVRIFGRYGKPDLPLAFLGRQQIEADFRRFVDRVAALDCVGAIEGPGTFALEREI